jgi:hypothetical protein
VLTPLSAVWNWPILVTIVLFSATLVLLLFVGQTVIFLLRLVAADRRASGRRRPMRSTSKTVGELEDESPNETPHETRDDEPDDGAGPDGGDRG